MPQRTTRRLAKLTRPRTHGALARERLFALIDARRERPALWISGPPGVGKTTLVATYCERAGIPAVWYHADAGDSDPAAFFYYLGLALADHGGRGQPRLPLLTPEFVPGIESFGRHFFRLAFGRLPDSSLLVIDNYHEIAGESSLHRALAAAVQEIPESANLIVVSRTSAPAEFSRAALSGTLTTLDWEELRLTPEETHAIVGQAGAAPAPFAEAIHTRSGGWVAGVRLLLEERGGADLQAAPDSPQPHEATFEYFAAEVLARLPADSREVLPRLSFVPRFTARAAIALSGHPKADRLVADLHRRRLFVDRLPGAEPEYRFHDLFRAYLQHNVHEQLGDRERDDLLRRSGELLIREGRWDEAFPLLAQGNDRDAVIGLVLGHAETLLAQGRWQTVLAWIACLPDEVRHQHCWLCYWFGNALLQRDLEAGRRSLERAYDLALLASDALCALLAASRIVHVMNFNVLSAADMDAWAARLLDSLNRLPDSRSDTAEASARGALIQALALRSPDSPHLAPQAEWLLRYLSSEAPTESRLSAGYCVAVYSLTVGPIESVIAASAVMQRVWSPGRFGWLVDTEVASALLWMNILLRDFSAAEHWARTRRDLDSTFPVDGFESVTAEFETWLATERGDATAAKRHLAHWKARADMQRPYARGHIGLLDGYTALVEQKFETARTVLRDAIIPLEADGRILPRTLVRHGITVACVLAGRMEEARSFTMESREISSRFPGAWLRTRGLFVEAFLAIRSGDLSTAECSVRTAFDACAARGDLGVVCSYPHVFEEIAAFALSHDIHADYVREFVKRNRFTPPPNAPEAWPWPMRIRALGAFEVSVGDGPLPVGRKTPRKALALLQMLVASGPNPVPEPHVLDILWPGEEGDAAREALVALVHRLRKLLGDPGVLHHKGASLWLDRQRCWVDVWAFEARIANDGDDLEAFALYRGPLFGREEGSAWSLHARERLRGRFIAAAERHGRSLEAAGRHDEALDTYRHGLDADNLVESFHLGCMRCLRALGRPVESMAQYRRMRDLLSVTLGVKPSEEGRRLFDELRKEQS